MNNIVENNRLIAEFLNWECDDVELIALDKFRKIIPFEHKVKGKTQYFTTTIFKYKYAEFHTNWNWIMEVVQAIEEKGYVVAIKGISCAIYPLLKDKPEDYISSYVCGDLSKKIDIVYSACIGFITWHNQQTK